MIDNKTANCVDCAAAPARGYCGYVLDEATGERILAGWCDGCWSETPGDDGSIIEEPKRLTIQPGGFVRAWEPAMGKVRWKPEAES